MALIEINLKPSKKDLTVFALGGCGILLVAALVVFLKGHSTASAVLVGIGLVLVISRLVSLTLTTWIYRIFVIATLPIGWTISHVIMFLFYYGLLLPVGLFFRLIGRDPLKRQLDLQATTYWEVHQPAQNKKRYFQQF